MSKFAKSKVFFFAIILCGVYSVSADSAAFAQTVPRYRVDPSWPKPLPNNWTIGQIGGIAVDSQDHIWVLSRPRTVQTVENGPATLHSNCCFPAPAVLEFDSDGNLLQSWGGKGWVPDWPVEEDGIQVDRENNIWITGDGPNGRGAPDRQVLKFTKDGKKLILEIGHPSTEPENNSDTSILGGPAGIELDESAHEIYIADGSENKRVVVYDSNTGAFKRGWGAYGIPLSEIANSPAPAYDPLGGVNKQFWGALQCIRLSADHLVYVCDQRGDRVQVFTTQGKFVKEFFVAPKTLVNGSVWTLGFSHDPAQRYLFVGDGGNNMIWILNRGTGAAEGSFGHAGRYAGQFRWIHAMAMDSRGNIYTGETGTKRAQKFLLQADASGN